MPRKKLLYTHRFPYHVTARSNNREWFYLSKNEMWGIFTIQINKLIQEYRIQVHSFVLMDNHYHLILSTDAEFDLGIVMRELQREVTRAINRTSGRSNHVFGGPYKPSLIRNIDSYLRITKYVYRNPVEVGLVDKVEDYRYSTLNRGCIVLTKPELLGNYECDNKYLSEWFNQSEPVENKLAIKKGLKKTEFKPVYSRHY